MNKKALSNEAILKIMWIFVIAIGVYLAVKIIQGWA